MNRTSEARPLRARALVVAGVVALLLGTTAGSWAVSPAGPGRALSDAATGPPVYRWVKPPANVIADAEAPLPGEGEVGSTGSGSAAASIGTGDGQATAVFPAGAFAPGEGSVEVTIAPVDPSTMPAPPDGLVLDGNAYRVEATSEASPAHLSSPATIALRYPVRATRVLHLEDGRWRELRTTVVIASLIVYGDTDALGTFAPAGPPPPREHRSPSMPLAAGAAAAAVAFAHVARVRGARR